MDVAKRELRTPLQRASLSVIASLLAMTAGVVLINIADQVRFDHVRKAALSCANWPSFAMPATVFGEGWAALLLFGLSAWLAWTELLQLGRPAALAVQERRLVFTTARIFIGLLTLGALLMIWAGTEDVYQTHQQALPPLAECSP